MGLMVIPRARLLFLPGLVLSLLSACGADDAPDPGGAGAGAGGKSGGAAGAGRAGASSGKGGAGDGGAGEGGEGIGAPGGRGQGGAGEAGQAAPSGDAGFAGEGSSAAGSAGEAAGASDGGAAPGAAGEAGSPGAGSSGDGGAAGETGVADCSAPPALALAPVFSGHSAPVFMGQAPGDPGAWFVVEQTGLVKIWRPSASDTPSVYLDLTGLVLIGSEQGLLGLAFHPNFSDNGRFYVNYTALAEPAGQTIIAEYERATADVANPSPLRIIHHVDQPYSNHNGGHLVFGPSGLLYVGLGDGGAGFDPEQNGQDDATHLGKMLRIDIEPAVPIISVWAKGLRNPWRYSIDPVTQLLYIGDVGQGEREEIDVVPANTNGGYNFGWRRYEGNLLLTPDDPEIPNALPPAVERPHAEGCAIVGGQVYRGAAIPCLQGTYLYGDYCTGRIRAFRYRQGKALGDAELSLVAPGLSSFGVDHAGEIYLVQLGGVISRIVPE
jgi:glucose/arabinose dehydrogenase